MGYKIGLVGNPNSGKTTIFNELTGSRQYVGNWAGVTVEKKGGQLRNHKDVEIIDLPGIYSLSPYTIEEVVTRKFMLEDKPDAIINIVDASNIERNLYLTTQILELNIPTIVALNMMDIVEKRGYKIDIDKLSKELGCRVVETKALKGDGVKQLGDEAVKIAKEKKISNFKVNFSKEVNSALKSIESLIEKENVLKEDIDKRWFAIKTFEKDEAAFKEVNLSEEGTEELDNIISRCEKELDDDGESIIISNRYDFIEGIISRIVKNRKKKENTFSDKIDKILLNRIFALPIFAFVMWFVYYISVSKIGLIGTDWINDVLFAEIIMGNVETLLNGLHVSQWLISLINDGILAGVGTVISFIPQVALLFFFLSILEDCGYMARVALFMDKILHKFGLSGKSFIPVLMSSGCGVPGIMSTRTMESERERKITIMVSTFVPCSAKLPIIALFAGAIFKGSSLVAPLVYFSGIIMIIVSAFIINKSKLFKGGRSPFVMELPQYHVPNFKNVLLNVWEKVVSFIKKAFTVIVLASAFIWFTSSFNWTLQMVDARESILADMGKIIAPIFAPLGFGNWQSAVASITGFVAKENIVSTFGVLFGISNAAETDVALLHNLAGMYTGASAFAFIAFNMFNPPCFAAMGAIRREMGNWKWTFITIGIQTFGAYLIALLINQVGSFIMGYGSLTGAIASIAVVGTIIGAIIMNSKKVSEKEAISEVA
ncbi:ferrous iron transport protein B [[Clostridium] dakarense]|uniref:ferrous iron transport protein B n=1 Tax=Faecalimicrobium dakarense TaxID=1301100 RepID=UPI0004B3C7FA|nr:ferrous iron transport protein B [[Clostridium] dakarense]